MRANDWGRNDRRRISTARIPAAVLRLVDARQGGRVCAHPDPRHTCHGPLEIDHKLPLSRGGTNHHLNLQWLCRRANRSRQAKLLREFAV